MRLKAHGLCYVVILLLFTAGITSAEIPQGIYYQGRLTDPAGVPIANGANLIKFVLYDAEVDGTELWNSQFQSVMVVDGVFSVHLGAPPMDPLPWDIFSADSSRFLGITVGVDPEIVPRTKFTSLAYAYHSKTCDRAQTVVQGRDLYHNIMDLGPNGDIRVPFIANGDAPTVTLYLYGDEFQAALAEHTHDGNNAHGHTLTGTVQTRSLSHSHSYSGTSGNNSRSHTHSGTTGSQNHSHSHTVTVDPHNLRHNHGGASQNAVHDHVLWVDGYPGSGNYLVHAGTDGPNQLSCSNTADRSCLGSVADNTHNHGINNDLSTSVGHTESCGIQLSSHQHAFSTGNNSVTHTHSYSGITGSEDTSHDHGFTGSVGESGTGLSSTGTAPSALPGSVAVYVDDILAAGPFMGEFASGSIDLSGYVTGAGEHFVEIREEGGSGGRITYNLFVE